jgi:hypothetical protein
MLSTEINVLRRSARKLRMERIKYQYIKEIIVVKGKLDIIDMTEREILQKNSHVKSMSEERIQKLIMEWIPQERRIK